MANLSFSIELGVVVAVVIPLLAAIWYIATWKTKIDMWKKGIDGWKNTIEVRLSGYRAITVKPADSKDQQIAAKQINAKIDDSLKLILSTVLYAGNPISIEEKERFNGYREKAALGEAFTIEEYTDFKSLADKISNELPEDKKKEFGDLISDLLKVIFRMSIERIEKSGTRFIGDYIIQPGSNLKKANLKGADMAGANLSKADLRSANLTKTDLQRANLSNANLKDAKLAHAKLKHAILDNSILKGADLRRCKFWHASLENVDMSGADVRGAEFYSANLKGAVFENADLKGTSLLSADLRKAKFKGAEFLDTNLNNAKLDGADFRGADLDTSTRINSLKKCRWENAIFDKWVREELEKSL